MEAPTPYGETIQLIADHLTPEQWDILRANCYDMEYEVKNGFITVPKWIANKMLHVAPMFVIEPQVLPPSPPQWWLDLYTDCNGNAFSDADSGL